MTDKILREIGALWHVWVRGVNSGPVYGDAGDHAAYIARLAKLARECDVRILARAELFNHLHLILAVAFADLANVLNRLLSPHARNYNARHDRTGPLFERAKARQLETDHELRVGIRYTVDNRRRHGVVPDLDAQLHDRMTSFGPMLGVGNAPGVDLESALAAFGGTTVEEQRANFLSFVRLGRHEPGELPEFEGGSGRIQELDFEGVNSVYSLERRVLDPRPTIATLVAATAEKHGLSRQELVGASRTERVAAARRELAIMATQGGYSRSEIARALGVAPSTIAKALARTPDIHSGG